MKKKLPLVDSTRWKRRFAFLPRLIQFEGDQEFTWLWLEFYWEKQRFFVRGMDDNFYWLSLKKYRQTL